MNVARRADSSRGTVARAAAPVHAQNESATPTPAPSSARARTTVAQRPSGFLAMLKAEVASIAPALQAHAATRVSSPSDPAEKEADTTAKKVMGMDAPGPSAFGRLQGIARRPLVSRAINRLAATVETGRRWVATAQTIARRGDGPSVVPAPIAAEIASRRGAGHALPPGVRRFMEPRFRADFGRVRVHTDHGAGRLSNQLGAHAFTVGSDIFFARGRFQPHARDGQELIAHELTHTIQQGAVPQAPVARSEDASVTQQASPHVQRLGLDTVLNYFADKANIIPGFRMFTIVLGVNPINGSSVDRSGANILRALIEFLPGGGLISQALESSGIFDKAGKFVEQQIRSLGLVGSAIKQAVSQFIDSLGLRDLASPGGAWDRAKRIVTEPIDRIKDFGAGLWKGIVELVKDAILRPLAKLAEGTAGYTLLKAVLGKDPVTGDPFPRTAENLIGPFMTLIGQEEIWENMKKANAIARAFAWFQGALSGLMGFVQQVPGLFVQAFRALELLDIILVPRAFAKLAAVFGGFLAKFVSWAGGTIWNLLEIIFEVVKPGALGYIKKTGAALKSILKNPLPFIGNLVRAAKLGFQNFGTNIGTHLKAALIDWLTGSLPGVYIPKSFALGELLKFVLSVLGLTWANIRAKLVKATSENVVKGLETAFDIVVALVRDGPAAAWEKIKEQLSNLKDMVVGAITDMVVDMVLKKAVPKLIAMFIPGAGFISAIISIYETVMVFVEKISKIIQVVTAFIDSIVAIAAGAIGAAASRVEGILANLLSLAISFLAGFAGLGRVADKVMGVLNKYVRAPIDKALDWLVNWIVTTAKTLFAKVFGKDKKDDRTPQQKQSDLDRAIAEAEALQRRPKIKEAAIRQGLLAIKSRYRMTSLELIVDRKEGITETVHVRGSINPNKDGSQGAIEEGTVAPIPYDVGSSIKVRYGGGDMWVATITAKTADLITYAFADPRKGRISTRLDRFAQQVASGEIQPYIADRRGLFMGRNPDRNGPVGIAIKNRYMSRRWYQGPPDHPVEQVRFPPADSGAWVAIADCDLSHRPQDAVTYWNREGYKYGPRSAEIRTFMSNPANYVFEPSGPNRSRGSEHGETYRDPYKD